MNVMIVGAGEVGFHLADRLCREGHHVTIVERDAEHARQSRNTRRGDTGAGPVETWLARW